MAKRTPRKSGAAVARDVPTSNPLLEQALRQKLERRAETTGGLGELEALADRLESGIRNSELLIFDGCAHAALYENVAEFNLRTLAFLRRHAGALSDKTGAVR